ncbi:AraC family transcriptional regulator [Agrobacterium rhizogenes]|jgi:AraC-like DNA-binding protein|uniref:helix-turn-helix domain-containing protein n=1 Tax=Rhizobium rhizogenes TaxID=359 RepID=UPI0004D54711|nr:AraC family transcriptional regulator [Rhizobium rhizogenes]OCJ04566.1 AraC family transcriptional regulator [Agrobacterium sp. 13-626]OCJ16312.1 AraC family transcriptional regulator [Agrobacterium sp. B131/95]OCJ21326.1 AraC family transcriptional regulator [Agrobacterium sp. B133/95]KEA03268.1 AraC family transcriptional regulator [Rhizobium rhizogenes]MQB35064.1 AraC family transcriptional regulator [Rhizobium rhizogenes]
MSSPIRSVQPRAPRKVAPQLAPKFEQILTTEHDTFLWRIDDYPWVRSLWNFHPEFEIHLIRKSSGTAYVGDYIGDFGPGDLTVIGSNLPHDWVSHIGKDDKIPGRDLVVQFDPDKLRQASQHLPEIKRLNSLLTTAQRGLRFSGATAQCAAHLLETIGKFDGLERLIRFLRVLELLADSKECDVLSSPEFAPNVDAITLNTMQRAILHINSHFTEKIQLPDVAAVANMSTNRFSRFFIKNTGRSFTDYVVSLRIGRACRLLSESDKPVIDICYEVGYTNLSNFNRSFLRHVGKSPSAYRRAAHGKRVSTDSQ